VRRHGRGDSSGRPCGWMFCSTVLVPVPSSWGTASKEARAYRSEGRGACMEPEGTRTVTCPTVSARTKRER
jgi:hypothetical protein